MIKHARRNVTAPYVAISPTFALAPKMELDEHRGVGVLASWSRIDGSTESNVQTAVTEFLTNASVTGVTVTCTPSTLSSATPGSQITVQTSVPFDQVSWVASSWFATDVTLSSSCMMRREGIP